jgi:hypothetical protein
MSNRFELLHRIIADDKSTSAERDAALRELDADRNTSQVSQTQDKELEKYWSNRETRDRSQLSTGTQDILNDLGRYILGIPPDAGVVARLTKLLDQTNSDIVRAKVVPVLRSINDLILSGRLIFGTDN